MTVICVPITEMMILMKYFLKNYQNLKEHEVYYRVIWEMKRKRPSLLNVLLPSMMVLEVLGRFSLGFFLESVLSFVAKIMIKYLSLPCSASSGSCCSCA